jgi:hypothetical protein
VAVGDLPDVVVATSVDQVEALRDAWQSACVSNIDSDIDYFLTVVRNAPWVIKPYVVCIRRPGKSDLFGICPAGGLPRRLSLGYRTLARPALRGIVLTFGGIVGAVGVEDEQLVLDGLERPLRTGEAEALALRRLDHAGSQYGQLKVAEDLYCACTVNRSLIAGPPKSQRRYSADFRTGTSTLGSGEFEAELASVPPGDGDVRGQVGLAEDG